MNLAYLEQYINDQTDNKFSFQNWIDQKNAFQELDLEEMPLDPNLLEYFSPEICSRIGAIPWQQLGQTTIFLIHNTTQKQKIQNALANRSNHFAFVKISEQKLSSIIKETYTPILLKRARQFCPSEYSIHGMHIPDGHLLMISMGLLLVTGIIWNPIIAINVIFAIISLLVLGNTLFRLLAIIHHFKNKSTQAPQSQKKITLMNWPSFSLLVPLYHETEMLSELIKNLEQLNYPKSLLDIKIIIEEDDIETVGAIAQLNLPSHFESIIVPQDDIRTKPKAMNYALPYCRGELVGVYDAEDCPDPNQLKDVALEFARAPKSTACVQCELDFYNSQQNWFTRCFTIEYRIWFSMLLPAMQHFKLPIPLGGTSVFFKRTVLNRVGAWDVYNVTEDADLGVRLKRMGYETSVIKSVTKEEANSRGISWIRQRSRWLKGYMISWINHMRHPIQLWHDLKLRGFLAVQVLFLGAVGNYLAIPVFWLIWPSLFGYDIIAFSKFPFWLRTEFFTVMVVSQAVSLTIGYLALRKGRFRKLIRWWLTLPFYWPFGAVASYKALLEMIFAPYYWDKTQHGNGKRDQQSKS